MNEVKEIVVETCCKIIEHYAQKHKTDNMNLRVRIDLEKIGAKPVFGVFNQSTIVERCTLKDIIRASGGKGFGMLIGVYIRNIIKEIFVQSLKELKISDPKGVFLLLYLLDTEDVNQPTIGLYQGNKFIWSLSIDEIMEASLEQIAK